MEKWNVNWGFRNLRVWQDAVELYVISTKVFSGFPFELKKPSANAIGAAHSISRNIAEGYCRKSIKEYLNFLNIALGSIGELHSSYICFFEAQQISGEDFETLDRLHFKTENELLSLIKSLQKKLKNNDWHDSFSDDKE